MATTGLTIVQDAYFELGVLGAADTLSGEDADFGLRKLNRLLDNWNADRMAVYAEQFLTFTLTPNLAPHTIGLAANTPTFAVTGNRPVSIPAANLILTNVTPNVRTPIVVRDAAWWDRVSVRALTSSIPTDLYYDPAWPNGNLNFWPVPTTAYGVELECRIVLLALTLVSAFSLPPGYQDAITLTLAEELAAPLQVAVPGTLSQKAIEARGRVFANNLVTPRLATKDSGMPGGGPGYFNWLDRSIT